MLASRSSDLNIIESLWSDLKVSVAKCRPDTIEELWRICGDKWAQIQKIRKLYESLPRRIEEVIKMKERNTRWHMSALLVKTHIVNFLLQ